LVGVLRRFDRGVGLRCQPRRVTALVEYVPFGAYTMVVSRMTGLSAAVGVFVGRVWRAGVGPSVVTLRNGHVVDVTTKAAPTMRDLLELNDIAGHLGSVTGEDLGSLTGIEVASIEAEGCDVTRLLPPCDLQAVKACGVTFARSMIERVIEERAAGDPGYAEAIRGRVAGVVGDSLRNIVPGSVKAAEVKALLLREGLWSQYLEVGIGPDAEVFTKCPPMAAVGWGSAVGLHPESKWNNPEPEVVLAVDSRGRVRGATLGNDVNLRDVEGRSALLLGKAKDNNASASVGPFIRLFDCSFTLDDVRRAELTLTVEGERDGFRLEGRSSMIEISRDPLELVSQTRGRHHQYPDGFLLYCGTMFAPVQDRDGPGKGFTHHLGDRVTIAAHGLGVLTNTVRLATEAPEWTFGTAALMRNLAARGLM
jgi:fumarylacetoacetate (FAA) hydrolase family protein